MPKWGKGDIVKAVREDHSLGSEKAPWQTPLEDVRCLPFHLKQSPTTIPASGISENSFILGLSLPGTLQIDLLFCLNHLHASETGPRKAK